LPEQADAQAPTAAEGPVRSHNPSLKRHHENRELKFIELESGKFACHWQQDPPAGARALNESELAKLEVPRRTKSGSHK
jgi:hypothetical protein